MSLVTTIVQCQDYLKLDVEGRYDLDDAVDGFADLIERCRQQNCDRVLIDIRNVESSPFATDRVLYAFEVERKYLRHVHADRRDLRIAYLTSRNDANSPGKKVAGRNPVLQLQLFHDPLQAEEWLSSNDSIH